MVLILSAILQDGSGSFSNLVLWMEKEAFREIILHEGEEHEARVSSLGPLLPFVEGFGLSGSKVLNTVGLRLLLAHCMLRTVLLRVRVKC